MNVWLPTEFHGAPVFIDVLVAPVFTVDQSVPVNLTTIISGVSGRTRKPDTPTSSNDELVVVEYKIMIQR